MKKQGLQRVLAWVLVVCLIMTTGINAWAEETVTEEQGAETEAVAENMLADTLSETEEITETAGEAGETVVETETESETETETQTAVETEMETQAVVETETETEAFLQKQTRTGTDKSEFFKVHSLVIDRNSNEIYREEDGVVKKPAPGEGPIPESGGAYGIGINLAWGLINEDQNNFNENDYIEFEICELVTVSTSNVKWSGLTGKQSLVDDTTLEVLGIGELRTEKVGNEEKLIYRVTFNKNIEGRSRISGEVKLEASVSGQQVDETITIKKEENSFYEFTRIGGSDPGYTGITPPAITPEQGKNLIKYDKSTNYLTWRIRWNAFLNNRYEDAKNGYTSRGYQDLVMEETLDCYQTFHLNGGNPGKAIMTIYCPLYFYDPDGVFIKDDLTSNFNSPSISLTTLTSSGQFTYIDPSTKSSPEAAAQYVRENGRTWTIIEEADPKHSGETRERLLINFGAMGDDGFRFDTASLGAQYQTNMNTMASTITKFEKIIADADAAGLAEDTMLNDWIGKNPRKLSEWRKYLKLYQDTWNYYNTNPYVYAFAIDVSSAVDPTDEKVAVVDRVENSCVIYSGVTKVEDSATCDNRWSATIRAKAGEGEVQIYKADSLGGFTEGNNAEANLGTAAIPNVQFKVYEKGSSTAIKFKLNSTTKKYEYDTSGSEIVTTDSYGSIILAGLSHSKTYTIKEVAGAAGYYTETKEMNVTVSASAPVYTLFNNQARGVELTKVDADTQNNLAGAVFELYQEDDTLMKGFAVKEINGQKYLVYTGKETDQESLVTDANGKLTIMQLPEGKYYFKEITAPTDYVVPADSDNKFGFTLNSSLDQGESAVVNYGTIENVRYEASGSITFKGTKNISGRDFETGDSFTFELYEDRDGNGYGTMPLDSVTITPSTGSSETFSFGELDYDLDDVNNTYKYKIVEKQENAFGLLYDAKEYEAAYTIADNGDGSLAITGSMDLADEKEVVFTNKKIEIDTTAVDIDGAERTTGEVQKGHISDGMEIIEDTVYYTNLKPNTKYVAEGVLMHYTSPLLTHLAVEYREFDDDGTGHDSGNGAIVKQLQEFTTDATGTGTVKVTFTFNGKNLGLAMHSYLTAYEYVYEYDASAEDSKGALVASHEDIEDLDQTVSYMQGSGSHLYETSFTVVKEWVDDNDKGGLRPTSITVDLYQWVTGNEADKVLFDTQTITAAADGSWGYTWSALPQYDSTHTLYEYGVEEHAVTDYETTYDEENGKIINTLNPVREWYLKKVDADGAALSGAEFTLEDTAGTKTVLTSGSDGKAALALAPGSYTLTETKAPTGYVLADLPITLVVSDGYVLSLGTDTPPNVTLENGGMEVQVVNEKEPTTGGLEKAEVKVKKSVDKSQAAVNDIITYTIVAEHQGDDVTLTDIEVKDYIPENTKFVSVENDGEYGYEDGKEYVSWTIDQLKPGESKTFKFKVKVDDCVAGTKIRNKAIVTTVEGNKLESNEVVTTVKDKEEKPAITTKNGTINRITSNKVSTSVKTGDDNLSLVTYLIILIGAFGIILLMKKKRA